MHIVDLSNKDNVQLTPDIIDPVISLMREQMAAIGRQQSHDEIRTAMENALKPGSRAHLFVAYDDVEDLSQPVALCFANICSGIESGGDYLWINEIHTREDRRGERVGELLFGFIFEWARNHGCRYALGVTSKNNESAQRLCARQGFEESEVIWLNKPLADN